MSHQMATHIYYPRIHRPIWSLIRKTPSFVASVPELRQFSFILTGDEEVADVAVAKALKNWHLQVLPLQAGSRAIEVGFFAHLLQVLRQTTQQQQHVNSCGVSGLITLLQFRMRNAPVLVLTEGLPLRSGDHIDHNGPFA